MNIWNASVMKEKYSSFRRTQMAPITSDSSAVPRTVVSMASGIENCPLCINSPNM